MFDVIIAAGGSSVRTGFDKLCAGLGDRTVLQRTVDAFKAVPDIDKIIVAGGDIDIDGVLRADGGVTRHHSVASGLSLAEADHVLIHDGARPFVSRALIERVMAATAAFGSAIPCLPMTDSVRVKDGNTVSAGAERSRYVIVQTPQGFKTEQLKRAFSAAAGKLAAGREYTDESEIYAEFIAPCRIVDGEESNRKITVAADFFGLNARVGTGFDVHRYVKGKPLRLCGEKVDFEYGLLAHSDGDAPLHAVMDAVLSALGERDIGVLFPDDDPAYENADSTALLAAVMKLAAEKNAVVHSVDVTIIAQNPRLSPYIEKMRRNIAAIMNIQPSAVSVSATTAENLGLVGENKALAALAAVTLI